MADFGAVQPRQFIMDSSRQNGATLGEFHQNNNRYLCTLELFDHSVPVSIPAGADISIKCKKVGTNQVYVLDKNNPDFAAKVSFTPGENKISVDRWGAMVSQDGNILLGVDIDGMSTYTVNYTVDKDLMSGAQVMHHETPITDFAKMDLSNVPKESMLKAAKAAGLAQNGLEDVDLAKLSEKVMDGDVGKLLKAVQSGVSTLNDPVTFDRELKSNAAFVALQNWHPATTGMTPSQIKALFYANRYEESGPVDLSQEPYSRSKVLLMAYQITSNGMTITQQMPPVANGQVIMIDVLRAPGVTGGKVVFTPSPGESLNGATQSVEVSREGYNGFWIPYDNEGSYDWYGNESTQESTLVVSDENGNTSIGVKAINFKSGFIEDDGSGTVNIVPEGDRGPSFLDGITGTEFNSNKVKSLDQSVRIAKMSDGTADFSVDLPHIKEGVFATLGYPEPVNTNFHDQRPYFTPRFSHMQRYIGLDRTDKGWTIQDGSSEDPNITGGAAFHLGMWFAPEGSPVASADGYVELKVIDLMTGTYLAKKDGTVMAVRREYKMGQIIGPELLIAPYTASGQQKIAFEVDCSFSGQIITASPHSALYIQHVDDNAGTGLAELFFAQHIGYKIDGADRYYGYNAMNFAAALTKTEGVETVQPGDSEMLGNGLFIDARSALKVAISSNRLTITGDGSTLPVFSVGKIFSRLDSYNLRLKNLATKVKLQDKNNAFDYALVKWTKATDAALPILTGYQNGQPVFADGWVQVSKKFISEDVVSGIHEDTNAFTVPDDAEQIAVILYPAVSQIPTTLILADFEVDVTPAFTFPAIASTFPLAELHMRYYDSLYRAITTTPSGYASLRYTGNAAENKLPFGIVSGASSDLVNDRSWNTPGTSWVFEGDGLFKEDGKATIDYEIPTVYCGEKVQPGSTSSCSVWMGMKQPDGSFKEIPDSRVSFTVSKADKAPKRVKSGKFSIQVKRGDSIRMLFKSDTDDGVYIQSGTGGTPLLRVNIDFDELEEIDQRIIDLIQKGK